MKKILFIYIILLFSCEELTESSDFLAFQFYMDEGWIAFQADSMLIASDLFNTGLTLPGENNYSEAYTGLGWTYMYNANSTPGELSNSFRDSLRMLAKENFITAIEINTFKLPRQVYADALAGMAYVYSYLADTSIASSFNNQYFDEIEYEQNLHNVLLLIDELIGEQYFDFGIDQIDNTFDEGEGNNQYDVGEYYSDTNINDLYDLGFDLNYDFSYDQCVNSDNIKILRAKTYLRKGLSEFMLNELNSLSYNSCPEGMDLDSLEGGINCLSYLSHYLALCSY